MITRIIHDHSTKEERMERSKTKDKNFRHLLKELEYENEGVLFLKSLNNACLRRLQVEDHRFVIYFSMKDLPLALQFIGRHKNLLRITVQLASWKKKIYE